MNSIAILFGFGLMSICCSCLLLLLYLVSKGNTGNTSTAQTSSDATNTSTAQTSSNATNTNTAAIYNNLKTNQYYQSTCDSQTLAYASYLDGAGVVAAVSGQSCPSGLVNGAAVYYANVCVRSLTPSDSDKTQMNTLMNCWISKLLHK